MEQKILYELSPSQEVSKLQCAYSIFKRVINILTSASTSQQLDFDLMTKALNVCVQRHDCTRIRFVKKGRKLMQYFVDSYEYKDIPLYQFSTKAEQEEFINKQSKKAIKYKKGVVLEPTFIKTYDGKSMVFLKVCHMILDAYGINVFIDDLFNVYNCLKDNQPLPEAPKKFEDLIKKDLIVKHDEEKIKSDYDYFTKVLTENPEPYYLGLDGGTNKIASKCRAKNIRPCKMLFVRNKTKLYGHGISKEVCDKLIAFATEHNTTIANLLMYLYSVTQSRVNNDLDTVLQLELCNMRGTLLAKKCSGTKVQSLSCVTKIDKDLSFEENLKTFVEMQSENYRHIGMGDLDMQILHHSIYKTSMLYTYYSFTFSFIPYRKNGDVELQFYSNGRCALPVYAAVMYDYENNEIGVGYDCQERLVSEQNIKDFHNNLLYVIEQVIENPTVKVKDIKLK